MNNIKSLQEPELFEYARKKDADDLLKNFRSQFYIPQINGKDVVYFCGNSLGLQPKTVKHAIEEELDVWKNMGVEGHFKSKNPWLSYHKNLRTALAAISGAKTHEVVAMNSLTANLHLMMVSFSRPTPGRHKIIVESGAFPSDQYAIESQVKFHGFDPAEAIIELKPKPGKNNIQHTDIISSIKMHSEELALVLLAGVQYYTGQVFNMRDITLAAHDVGAFAGFDLAHAIGNILLNLHDWEVDFAVWCSYKYLNSGPGNVGGAFVHEKFGNSPNMPRFAGWWGHDEEKRFRMEKGFQPIFGADGWQLSNANILPLAAQWAALKITEEADMINLRKKSINLTSFLFDHIKKLDPESKKIKVLTPENSDERGCQLSLFIPEKGNLLFEKISKAGIVVDWREPNVIRVAPTPLYNTFEEVYELLIIIQENLARL